MHRRLAFIDTLRGIAVLAVLLQHALEQIVLNGSAGDYYRILHNAVGEYFNFGRFGVALFFFVSGFVIPNSFPDSSAPIRDFAISRVFRLYPAYWVSIVVVLLIAPGFEAKTFPLSQILANITMLQMFMNVPNLNIGYWTLAVELIFYVACIALFAIGFLRTRWTAICIVVAASLTAIVAAPFVKAHLFWGLLELMLDLTAMFLGKVVRDAVIGERLQWRHVAICTLLYVLYAAVCAYRRYGVDYQDNFFCAYGMGAAYIAAAIVFVAFAGLGERGAVGVLSFVGRISYSVYLMGPYALVVVVHFFGTGQSPLQWSVFVIGVACVSILVSWLNYLTVEKPMIAFGLRFRSQALRAVTLQPSLRGQGAE
ncbi:acyltransferase [Bradyrhizobium sp. INPA01-394B]|uniref:Acyltransferase n=1 Tax=Bradyrhizobium campsiandrae TaxID=1729892 RepID=A0ABR7U7F9_9BRAD|nr:acyltransferase [Bradyrhizobium campsiandrae]MBC9876944.1 acyltransferase [Bradyrhizobium campsiandrae]MBC9876993.1 acyltransferase [Bradyrhizobium campsiandrae]MBC9979743.1 acyltransferase [Bradyrhizobium campsiandrae]